MPARAGAQLLVVGVVAYLLVPGHPLSLLRGVPLDWLSLAALVSVGCLIFAFGVGNLTPQPLRGANVGGADVPLRRGEGEMCSPLPRTGTSAKPMFAPRSGGARGEGLLIVLALMVAAKLLFWAIAPPYGLQASYYPSARISGGPERSTDARAWTYTRIEQSPGQPGFALHFFNDVERFNYYEPPDPDRKSLPFAVRWDGYMHIPEDGDYMLGLAAQGTGILSIDGSPMLTIGNVGYRAKDMVTVHLEVGVRPVRLEFMSPGIEAPSVFLDTPRTLTVEPVSAETLARDRYVRIFAIGVDLLVLGAIVVAVAVAVARHTRLVREANSDRFALLERPVLACLLLTVLAYALVTTHDLVGRAVILEGGQDWLTYESYARDILLNGPLMTLGEVLGKGKPFFFQPFYPYYLAALHWLSGEGLWGPIVLQLFGVGVAGVLVYYLAKRLFGVWSAAAALCIFLLLGLSQLDWIARKLLSENLYFILLPAAVLVLVRAIDERRLRDVAWAGLVLGVASITRAPTLLFVPGAALILAVAWRRAGVPLRRAVLAFALLGLCTAAVSALVPVRNYVVSGRPALVATNGGATLLLAHQPTERVRLSGIDRDPLYNALKLDRATREVFEFARQDPAGYLWTLVPLGLYAIGISGGIEGTGIVTPDVLAITILYVLALLLVPGARSLRALPLHLFVLIHLAIMMTFLPYVYGYRQVLPMQILMLVFGGALLAHVGQLVGARRRSNRERQPLMEQRTA
jgi:hypothetical protein